jgi:c-di-GMP-binding flagellar brake protein YcgR
MILNTVNGIEQREHPSAEIRWPVTIRPPWGTIKGETLNVSSMGAFLKSSEPLKFNEVFILDMDVPALDYPLKAIAEVVWLNRNGNKNEITPYGIGIRFIRISSADQRFIINEVLRHLNSESVETSSSVVFQTTAADQEVESGEAM